jgi:type 1 glutamine amidotransferase
MSSIARLKTISRAMSGGMTLINRRALISGSAASLAAAALPHAGTADDRNPKKRRLLLFFSKSSGFEHDPVKRRGRRPSLAETVLTEIGKRRGFEVVATKDGRVFDGDLARQDAFFFFTTGDLTQPGTDGAPPMSATGKEALLAAIRGGKGFIGIHSASDTFHSKGAAFETQQNPDSYIAMLGGEFISHGSEQEARVKIVDGNFPGLRGLGESLKTEEEWYSLKNFADDIHVLLVLDTDGMRDSEYRRPPFPLAWARREGLGRVYYNAMGHREDVWRSRRFQEMLAGAVAWATGAANAALIANMAEVTPHASVLPSQN